MARLPTTINLSARNSFMPMAQRKCETHSCANYSFSWNGLYASQDRSDDRKEIGLIAQEVEAVFPELVTTWEDEDSKAVEYGRFSAVLLAAVKELKANVEALTTKIALLQS